MTEHDSMTLTTLTPDLADRFATLALSHVTREYPNKMDHVLNGPEDIRGPCDLHPIFYGSFDWHSCVHGYWMLARLYRRFPTLPERDQIRTLFDTHLTPAHVAGEVAYLARPNSRGFERPYGWAWLLMLVAELARHDTPEGCAWYTALTPLGDAFAQRWIDFLPKATYPVRTGTHTNTAFALALTTEYARTVGHDTLMTMIEDRANAWYRGDTYYSGLEPSGDDFLSPGLVEVECMRRVLDPETFQRWYGRFLPYIGVHEPDMLFKPVTVSDRTDGKIAHLDGLNLSRAWCWRTVAFTWDADDPRRAIALETAERHLNASLPHVAGDYMGEHWLATFAVLALEAVERA